MSCPCLPLQFSFFRNGDSPFDQLWLAGTHFIHTVNASWARASNIHTVIRWLYCHKWRGLEQVIEALTSIPRILPRRLAYTSSTCECKSSERLGVFTKSLHKPRQTVELSRWHCKKLDKENSLLCRHFC